VVDALALVLYLQYHNWELESVDGWLGILKESVTAMHHSDLYILVTYALELACAFLSFDPYLMSVSLVVEQLGCPLLLLPPGRLLLRGPSTTDSRWTASEMKLPHGRNGLKC